MITVMINKMKRMKMKTVKMMMTIIAMMLMADLPCVVL